MCHITTTAASFTAAEAHLHPALVLRAHTQRAPTEEGAWPLPASFTHPGSSLQIPLHSSSMNPLRVFRASRWLAADWRRRAGCRMALSSSWLGAPMITCTDLGSVTVLQLKTLISRTSLPYLPDRKQLYASWTLTPLRICPYLDISIMKYNGCHRKWHTEKSHAFLYIENKQTSSA